MYQNYSTKIQIPFFFDDIQSNNTTDFRNNTFYNIHNIQLNFLHKLHKHTHSQKFLNMIF